MNACKNSINENEEYKLEVINKKLKEEIENINIYNKKNEEALEYEYKNLNEKEKENDIDFLEIIENENEKFKNEINQLQKKIKVKKNK